MAVIPGDFFPTVLFFYSFAGVLFQSLVEPFFDDMVGNLVDLGLMIYLTVLFLVIMLSFVPLVELVFSFALTFSLTLLLFHQYFRLEGAFFHLFFFFLEELIL